MEKLDKIFYNGRIYTMDGQDTVCQAIGVLGGKIAFSGTDQEAAALECAARQDLGGKTVVPGFVDSHIHCVTYAWYENCVKLHSARSLADVLRIGRQYMQGKSFGPDSWIIGRGWDHNEFDVPEIFTRQDLDEISADTPIAFLRTCGHICVVNTRALELLTPIGKSQGLEHEIDAQKGIMYENAARLFFQAIKPFEADQLAQLIEYAAHRLNACGVTSIHSDDYRTLPVSSKYETLAAFNQLRDQGRLTLRVCCLNSYDSPQQLDTYIADGYKTGQGDEMIRIGPIKVISDGAFGGKTAALLEPYAGTDNMGILHYTAEELTQLIDHCRQNGLDVTIHAIGDRAMQNAVQAIEASNAKHGSDRRHGVLHAQFATPQTLERMGKSNVQAFIQPIFVDGGMDNAEVFLQKPQEKKMYAWRSMLDAGMAVSGGSCSPVADFDVIRGIYSAVTRQKLENGQPQGGWHPEERLTVKQAVQIYTAGGAYASYEEDIKGTLEPGKLADMVVLSQDIFTMEPEGIKDVQVEQTILGGKTVYSRE